MSTTLLHQLNMGPLSDGLALLPSKFDSLKARGLILTIVLQESAGIYRRQMGNGPARGLAQFELNGVKGLLEHKATKPHLAKLCATLKVEPKTHAIWSALEHNDVLAMAVARLNLYWHADPLPDLYAEQAGLAYYLDCWRPGAWKRHPEEVRERWHRNHETVVSYFTDRIE
jgi:hypothetical protein